MDLTDLIQTVLNCFEVLYMILGFVFGTFFWFVVAWFAFIYRGH